MGIATPVFISATSADLGSVRQLVKEALLSMDCHPVEMKNFPPDYRSVHDVLEDRIANCHAVLHIVGTRYGAEPDPAQLPATTPRRSYTQLEYDLARKLKKQLYIFLCPDDFPFDDSPPEEADKQALQQAHRAALMGHSHHYTKVATREEVDVKVRELQLELQQLRQTVRRSTFHVLIAIAALVLVLVGIGYGLAQLRQKVGDVRSQVEQQHFAMIEQLNQIEAKYADKNALFASGVTDQEANLAKLDQIMKELRDLRQRLIETPIDQDEYERLAFEELLKTEKSFWAQVEGIRERANDGADEDSSESIRPKG